MLCDYHIHSNFSDDSSYLMEDIVKDAIKKALKEICFTDHVDYGIKIDQHHLDHDIKDGELYNVHYPNYKKEYDRLKEKYAHQITLKFGLEFGMQVHTIDQFQKLFKQYPFDFILLSCHQVNNLEFWNQDFQKGKTVDEYHQAYYLEILQVIQNYQDYSVLAHLDLIERYDEKKYPFEKVKPIVVDILKKVIADGKGIEVNTSSARYGLNDLTPSKEILKLYQDMGGKIITIGSDSHEPSHLGEGIQKTRNLLKEIGFEYYCTYEKMQPIFHEL